MAAFEDGFWWSRDNLRLHYRDYAGRSDRPTILCLPGLTRNARDFAPLAERLAGDWRVICLEMRGRGESAYAKNPMSYVPLVYFQDVEAFLEQVDIGDFVGIGTSLGGLLLMLLSATMKDRLAGVVLNDIGPRIEEAGLDRIRQGVGSGAAYPTWVHAARAVSETQAAIYPDFELQDWVAFTKRLYRLNSKGRVVLDYDQRLAEPFRVPGGEAGVDLWPSLEGFRDVPALLLRGALSDILSAQTAQAMTARLPLMELVTVPRVGHAPTLYEPASAAAVDRLLERALAAQPVS